MTLKIGFGRAPIPVPLGTPLIGYATPAPRLSTGTHDPLYARALVLEQEGTPFTLVSCDLLSADRPLEERVGRLAAGLGLDPARLILLSTHTHSGPGGFSAAQDSGQPADAHFSFAHPIPAMADAVDGAIVAALTQATALVEDCTLSTAAVPAQGIGTDRNHPDSPGDPTLTLLRFTTQSGRTVLLYSTACHPTVLHLENTLVSADYPGVTSALLEQEGITMAMFLNGSAGDVSTRFTRKGTGFSEVERLGGLLAQQVTQALPQLREAGDFRLRLTSFTLPLKVRRVDERALEKELAGHQAALREALDRGADGGELRVLQSRCEGATVAVRYAKHQLPCDTISVRVRFLALGPLVLGFYPVELFSALSNPVRERFHRQFLPLSYAGGYLGYLTDPTVEQADSYEKYSTVYQFDQGVRLMAETTKHLEEEHYGKTE